MAIRNDFVLSVYRRWQVTEKILWFEDSKAKEFRTKSTYANHSTFDKAFTRVKESSCDGSAFTFVTGTLLTEYGVYS